MIRIEENGVAFEIPVKSELEKRMHELSPKAFELACISADVRKLMLCIDSKYGKGCALKLFSMVLADNYTAEDIDKVDKEINDNE